MSLKHYIYIHTYISRIHTYFERRLFEHMLPPPPIFGASTSQKNRIQDVNASLFGRLIERKLGGDGCLGRWDANKKNYNVFMVIFVPATGDWKLLTFWERAFFLCSDVEFEFLKIPMKHTDVQHLANQLVWFIQRCLINIHRTSKKSRYATIYFIKPSEVVPVWLAC